MRTRHENWARVVRIVCAMLLVFAGLAHKPVSAAPALSAIELAVFALPDGSLPDICTTQEDGSGKTMHPDRDCDACRIAAAVLLPAPPAQSAEIIRRDEASVFVKRPEQFHKLVLPPNASPRAPPIVPEFA